MVNRLLYRHSVNATNVTYEIFDEDGNLITNGTIGPNGTLPELDLPVGNYTVNWATIVDGNHISATNASTITVNPAPSVVEGENVTVTYGVPIVVPYDSVNATSIAYEIFDEDGNLVANGTVGPNGTIPVDLLPVGNYTVNWTTIVDGNHTSATNTSTITVLPVLITITVGNVTGYPGDEVTIPVNVTTNNGIPFNGNVTITLPDGTNKTVEIVNGTGTTTWTIPDDYIPGNYTDDATIQDVNPYMPSQGMGVVTVLPIPTQVSIGNVTSYPGQNVTIPINVTTINGKRFNGDVTVIMPDNTTQIVSIVNGTGTITWYVPEDYSPDKYPDTIRFLGNQQYLPSNGTGIIEVIHIPTYIAVGNVTTFAGMEVTIPINVTADDGKPFTGSVTITFPDGSTKTVEIVDGEGTTTWFVPYDYTPDKYTDTVKFAGNNKYLPSEGNGTITVIKIPVDLIVGSVSGRPGDHVVIPIDVIPRDGSVFNGKITVELPDGTVKTINIINGKGSVDWIIPKDYKAGKYPVKAYSDETNIYYPANGTGIVTVIEEPPVPPIDDGNKTHKDTSSKKDIPQNSLAKYETGNPILALLAVLALLGINIRRRK
jgi:hypothetical protein